MGSGIVADPNKEFTKILVKNFEEVWSNDSAYMGVGGSIPFANDFVEKFPMQSWCLLELEMKKWVTPMLRMKVFKLKILKIL